MTIEILNDELINKIAAGEVIERPANVVKELIENSIDAKATRITIEVNEGGKSHIKISDNGIGMSKRDAKLCLKRHATSKLSEDKDLFNISTLGFRGEALSSIQSISEVTLVTRRNVDIEGIQIKSNSTGVHFNSIGSAPGTTITVSNLFYNTPVRKKYLKTMQTELAVITDIVTRYSIGNPNIFFKLVSNDRIIISSPGTNDGLGNIIYIYGRDISKHLILLNYSENNIFITGYISKPELTKSSKSYQSVFINNRYVKTSILGDSIYQGYGNRLMIGRHPVVILNIKIAPDKIDVNIHPQKSIIKIQKEDEIFALISKSIILALDTLEIIPRIENKDIQNKLGSISGTYENIRSVLTNEKATADISGNQTLLQAAPIIKIEPINIDNSLPKMNPIGQIHKTYILAESEEGLLILDQHAVEERINYELFQKSLKIRSQPLLKPELIELPPHDALSLIENRQILIDIGFNFEEFGINAFQITGVPIIMGKTYSKKNFLDLISEISRAKKITHKFIHDRIATKACRASIKAGDFLTMPQISKLIEELGKCNDPYCCPHGRPTIINFTLYEIEKKFKRVV